MARGFYLLTMPPEAERKALFALRDNDKYIMVGVGYQNYVSLLTALKMGLVTESEAKQLRGRAADLVAF
jgi:hypothetical protein